MEFDRQAYLLQRSLDTESTIILDDDCPTLAHQFLKFMVSDGSKKVVALDHLSKKQTVSVQSDMGRAAIRLLAKDDNGFLFVNENNQMFRIYGSLLIDPMQPPDDKFALFALGSLIRSSGDKKRTHISEQLTVPMVYTEGRFVEGSYMVMSPAYTEEQYEDLVENEEDVPVWYAASTTRIKKKNQRIIWKAQPMIHPFRMDRISL